MSESGQIGTTRKLKKTVNKVFAIGGLCVVACKLPLLVALLGFGGISATASISNLPPIVRAASVLIAVLGIAAVIGYYFYRRFRFRRSNP